VPVTQGITEMHSKEKEAFSLSSGELHIVFNSTSRTKQTKQEVKEVTPTGVFSIAYSIHM